MLSDMPPMNGLYNIEADPDTPYIYYRSVRRLPSMNQFAKECVGLAQLLREVVSGYLEDGGFPEYNNCLEAVFSKDSIGEFPSDRTMCFFVGDVGAFTPDFVRLLQERVLVEYPLWRLVAQCAAEKNVVIYPKGVWLGDHLVRGDFDEAHSAYCAWFNEAKDDHEKRYGPLRRQIAYVRHLIPPAMAQAMRDKFTVLATFDCYQPHLPGHAVWLLQTAQSGELFMDTGFSPIRDSAVSDDGTIYPQYCEDFTPYSDRSPHFWLVTHLIDPDGPRKFVMKNARQRRVATVSVKEIVFDETLKEAERARDAKN